MRRARPLQQFLAVQRLELGAVRLDDVEVEAAGARLGDDALNDFSEPARRTSASRRTSCRRPRRAH